MQNKSHAVMSQRTEADDSPDDFPTPPWATRALFEFVLKDHLEKFRKMSCLEPACGLGFMSEVLKEYFFKVLSYDKYYYGYGDVADFLRADYPINKADWVITNPPFRLAEQFVLKSLNMAHHGVAILARTVFLESVGRYQNIYINNPPSIFAQFVERVPIIKGRVDPRATTATGYAWFVWKKATSAATHLRWIPPCRRELERPLDYVLPSERNA